VAKFATNTSVSTEKSRAELEAILNKYGSTGFSYRWQEINGVRVEHVEFLACDRAVRFSMVMPSRADREFMFTPARKERRSDKAAYEAWEQACRQRWRALCLAVKAKLECVEVGITEFEDEFLAHIVDPQTGRTMGETIRPQIAQRYAGIGGPIGLPGLPAPDQATDAG
jgi:hypothetical protein